jgi:aryl-alcohol dehydrogenase-like predicted oxidoreductase
MTIGQAAIQFCLAERHIVSVLPNITNEPQLIEFCQAPSRSPISPADVQRLYRLFDDNFHLASSTAG